MSRALVPLAVFLGAAALFALTIGHGTMKSRTHTGRPSNVAVAATVKDFTVAPLHHGDAGMAAAIRAEVANAEKLGRKPFVYFYADWCGPCRDLRDSMDDPLMADAFAGTYQIKVDVDEWEDEIDEDYQVPYIPLIFELGADGRPTGRTITSTAWDDNIPENMAPPLKAFFRVPSKT